MGDYGFEPYTADPEPEPSAPSRLPGGISLQTAAAVLLIAVVLATLYLFFGPMPDDGAAVPPTPTRLTAALTPPAATTAGTAAGTSVAPPVGAGGLSAATPSPGTLAGAATVSIAQPTGGTPSLLGASAVTTPLPGGALGAGSFVSVTGVGADGLRYRMGAGQDYLTIRIVAEGETLKVLGGPETEGGTVYWRVQDALGNVGWAAELFLVPMAAPSAWNPPVASPTFEAHLSDVQNNAPGAAGNTTAP